MRFLKAKNTKTKVRQPRKGRKTRHSARTVVRITAMVCLLAFLPGLAVWFWASGRAERAMNHVTQEIIIASSEMGLTVRNIFVEGRVETSGAGILAALKVKPGEPLFSFDPQKARERVETIGWVDTAVVERRLSGDIYVRLRERHPMALWQKDGRHVLIDREGIELIHDGLERFADLPVIVGKDAPRHAFELLALMASAPQIRRQVDAAIRIGGRRWNLRLVNGIDIRLPEENIETAWEKLVELEESHALFERDVIAIDLRIPDRLVVQLSKKAAAERKPIPGHNT